ncbi:hypothetical protein B5X24_HaOG212432 [Helicoverpa armigera]|uniref:Cadherin domain-containing protein n=1 Tax=Helicoverpa armigera TaxID=29058 RepID=A0A2W1BD34_HELAM|nr:hypothetical protein B5X24_HaOG212432 [Helicoverpa armigera]
METRWSFTIIWAAVCFASGSTNMLPVFTQDMNNLALSESTPVGTMVYRLQGTDPEGLPLTYSLVGTDKFSVDPVTGDVTLKKPLDREVEDTIKFLVSIEDEDPAKEQNLVQSQPVTVIVLDENDNPPMFKNSPYEVDVPEDEEVGKTILDNILVEDRDSVGDSLEVGCVPSEQWPEACETFEVVALNSSAHQYTGALVLKKPLNYNERQFYQYQLYATDGTLNSSTHIEIKVVDVQNTPPVFSGSLSAALAEDAPVGTLALTVHARDADRARPRPVLLELVTTPCATPGTAPCLDYETRKDYFLQYKATDDDGAGQMTVVSLQISLTDSNDNPPVFHTPVYKASIDEDAVKFEPELQVQARDIDATSDIRYSIIEPPTHPFSIDPINGKISVEAGGVTPPEDSNKILLTVLATDGVHNATCKVEIAVRDVNNHPPVFDTDRYNADISEDAPIGTEVAAVRATDLDSGMNSELKYWIQKGALDSFAIHNDTGVVTVSSKLDYDKRNTYTIQIVATDLGIPSLTGTTELTVNVINVNDKKPFFTPSIQRAEVSADAELGYTVHTLVADDPDITDNASLVFNMGDKVIRAVDKNGKEVSDEGVVKTAQRLDYEKLHSINFTLVAYDSGVPQLSTSAGVTVLLRNVNDEDPVFVAAAYDAAVTEHSPAGTSVLTVTAVDKDEDEFGEVTYSLSGDSSEQFTIDPQTGVITVAEGASLDREVTADVWLRAIASDNAPAHLRRSTSVPVHIKILDINDHAPIFSQNVYKSTIAENLQLNPPAAILQVLAEDKDEGLNGKIAYRIVEQSEPGVFTVNPQSGIIYPSKPVTGNTSYHLTVMAQDEAGAGPHSDIARVDITVLSVDNQNVGETPEFSLDKDTGELRTKTFLDREHKAEYQLVIAAVDNGTPAKFESLRLLTVVLVDDNDNAPMFASPLHQFSVNENLPPGVIVGTVKATDKDSGENGKVYYHVLEGNQEGAFTVDRTQGTIRANISFDREKQSDYTLTIYASNNPILEHAAAILNSVDNATDGHEPSVTVVRVRVKDDNDNEPKFQHKVYYAGIKHTALVNEPIISVIAEDPDLGENGTLVYMVAASNLYKFGDSQSSGSVVPSPFNISQDGILMTAHYMAEYNQDRFVLDIIAQEVAPPQRRATAQVYVWIIDRSSLIRMVRFLLIRMVVSRGCSTALGGVTRRLASASSALLVPGRRLPLVQADRRYDDCVQYKRDN